MATATELYGPPSSAFIAALPLMHTVAAHARHLRADSDTCDGAQFALASLPLRNALSLIERVTEERFAAAEERTLLRRLDHAVETLTDVADFADLVALRKSLVDLHGFLHRTCDSQSAETLNEAPWY